MTSSIISPAEFELLAEQMLTKLNQDSGFDPDSIVALSTGGFPVAAAIASRLGIPSSRVFGIPVLKTSEGDYLLSSCVELRDIEGWRCLVVDDSSNRGLLTKRAAEVVRLAGAEAQTAVLIANEDGILPHYFARVCRGKPPKFFWESSSSRVNSVNL